MLRRLWIPAALLLALGAAVWLLGLGGATPGIGAEPILEFDPAHKGGPTLRLRGLPPAQLARTRKLDAVGWRVAFPVYTEGEALRASANATVKATPMLGAYGVSGGEVLFRPRFSFQEGLTYLASWKGNGDSSPLELRFSLPREAHAPSVRVEALYPSGDVLPENLLRIYLHFTGPMSRGEAARRLQLLDEDGEAVASPFVAVPQELWNPAMNRLTVFLDPGRIKREVGPQVQVGAPILKGREYRLLVDRDWPDAEGATLVEGFEKRFRVGPADRSSPDPAGWWVEPFLAKEDGAVQVSFLEPVDHALGLRVVWVEDEDGARVPGQATLQDRETRWVFRPQTPLSAGSYFVVAAPELEDPSGNSLRRPFETPVTEQVGGTAERNRPYRLSFTIS